MGLDQESNTVTDQAAEVRREYATDHPTSRSEETRNDPEDRPTDRSRDEIFGGDGHSTDSDRPCCSDQRTGKHRLSVSNLPRRLPLSRRWIERVSHALTPS